MLITLSTDDAGRRRTNRQAPALPTAATQRAHGRAPVGLAPPRQWPQLGSSLGRIWGVRAALGRAWGESTTQAGTSLTERKEGSTQARYLIAHISAGQVHLNDDFKKISSWAAILFAPTLVGTIYGMNFDHMPELHWLLGYPFAIVLMAVVCTSLYVIFKRRDWL
ncbi:CorA family divalent cation transporter [Streptomyces sp. NPDC058371]|uniref:CorA family divalent cation transporter n=1 Tax=Streptomyces sp. NPDC058371 TaxID=3346463 RepID=UPI0036589146